jgi:autotransporter-associated beta strand protein
VALQPGTLLTLGTAADASFGGSFGGAGGLVKQGSGALTLGAANSHTGGTQVRQGRLVISADSQLGAAASVLLLDGGTLATTGAGNLVLDARRSLQVGLQGGTLDVAAAAGLDVRGPLSGGGALVKQGAGALQLAGDNSGFSGALDLRAGSLALQHALALGSANALHLAAGTLLACAGALLPLALVFGQFAAPPGAWVQAAPWVVVQGGLQATAFLLYFGLLARRGGVFTSQVGYIITLAGLAWGVALFDERHGWLTLPAVALVLLGLWLVTVRR